MGSKFTKSIKSVIASSLLLIMSVMLITLTTLKAEAVTSNPKNSVTQQNYIEQTSSAHILSQEETTQLNETLNQFARSQDDYSGELLHSQFAVYITDSLNGSSIEDYSQNLFNKKQIGDKAHNKGILLVVAVKDHKYRVQLGNGWKETSLNQASIKDYAFGDSLTEMLRSDNYNGAISQIVQRTIGITGQDVKLVQQLQPYSEAYDSNLTEQLEYQDKINTFFEKFISGVIKLLLIAVGIILSCFLIILAIKGIREITEVRNYEKVKNILNIDFSFDEDLDFLTNRSSLEEIAGNISKRFTRPTERNIKEYLKERVCEIRAEDDRRVAEENREKIVKDFMNKELVNYSNLPVSYYEIIKAFLNTRLDATDENMRDFIQNLVRNYELLQKQEDARYYRSEQQALKLTTHTPKIVYGNNIFEQLLVYDLLSSAFRNDAWQSSQIQHHYSSRGSYQASSNNYSNDDSSSSSDSTWSDFGGGGGFSGGDGASGGW